MQRGRELRRVGARCWAAVGLSNSALAKLLSAELRIEDLPSHVLGAAAGNVIRLDDNAAGFGWFVDPTPFDDAEFEELLTADLLHSSTSGETADRMDLLTAVMHELGHLLGLDDLDEAKSAYESLMSHALSPGIRRLPG